MTMTFDLATPNFNHFDAFDVGTRRSKMIGPKLWLLGCEQTCVHFRTKWSHVSIEILVLFLKATAGIRAPRVPPRLQGSLIS